MNENAVQITVTCPVSKEELQRDSDMFWDGVKTLFCESLDDLRAEKEKD